MAVDRSPRGLAQPHQRIILDHFLARGQNKLQLRRIEDIDKYAPVSLLLGDDRQSARHGDPMEVDRGRVDVRAIVVEHADPDAVLLEDRLCAVQPVTSLELLAVKRDRDRAMTGGAARRADKSARPEGIERNDDLGADCPVTGLDGDRTAVLPGLGRNTDRPSDGRPARTRPDDDVAPGETEDAHASGILPLCRRAVPTRAPERQNDRGVINTDTVIDDRKMRFVIDRQNVEFDQAGTGAPAILDKLTEYVADGIVEETRYLRDGGRIDLAVNDGGKGHGDAPDIERDCSPLRSPSPLCLAAAVNRPWEA